MAEETAWAPDAPGVTTMGLLAAAWDEGRLECPPCPVCGEPLPPHLVDTRTDVEDVYDMEPMWPGGPVVPCSLDPVSQRVTAIWRTGPCGHEFDSMRRPPMTWTVHVRPASDTGAPDGARV